MTIQIPIDRRSAHRKRVLMSATVVSVNGSQKVRVADVSSRGARIYAATGLQPGHDVCFCTGHFFIAARVAWVRAGFAGLQFYRELTDSERQVAFP